MFESVGVAAPVELREPRKFGPLFFLGLALFAASFWLPAINGVGNSSSRDALPGYACAWMSIRMGFESMKDHFFTGLCMAWAGLSNGVMLLWLVLRLLRARWPWRRAAAVGALLGSVPCSLLLLGLMKLKPIEGYFAWVIGMALMVADDWRKKTAGRSIQTPDEA